MFQARTLSSLVFTTALTLLGSASAQDLTIWSLWSEAEGTGTVFKEVLETFQADTGLTVEHTTFGEDLPEAYETAVLAGRQPDIVIVNLVDKPADWLELGATVPVTAWLDEWGLRDRILDVALEQWTNPDGEIQAFPYSGFVWPVWYNTQILEEANIEIPTTTDELIAASKALREAGKAPVVVGGIDWSGNKLFWQVMQSYVPAEEVIPLFQEGGYCKNEGAKRGIELFFSLRDAGVFADNVEGLQAANMNSAYFDASASIMPAGTWAIAETPEAVAQVTYLGGFPVPADGVYKKPTAYAGFTGAAFWVSPSGAEKVDTVKTFVEHMYEPEIAARFVAEGNNISPLKDIPIDDSSAAPLLIQAQNELNARVEYAVLADAYIPGDAVGQTERATALAFTPGSSLDEVCSALDAAYR